MDPLIIASLEAALGRALRPEDEHAVTHLNRIPPALVDEARRLPAYDVHDFLRYHVDPASHTYLYGFAAEVVEGGVDPAAWSRGGVLVLGHGLAELLSRGVDALLAPLGRREGEAWMRVRPRRERWDQGVHSCGSPALAQPEIDYLWRPPEGVYALDPASAALEAVDDVGTATRRLVASRVARVLLGRRELAGTEEPGEVIRAALPGAGPPSADALAAVAGLLAEQRHLGPPGADEVPGFRGPDAWFAGDAAGR